MRRSPWSSTSCVRRAFYRHGIPVVSSLLAVTFFAVVAPALFTAADAAVTAPFQDSPFGTFVNMLKNKDTIPAFYMVVGAYQHGGKHHQARRRPCEVAQRERKQEKIGRGESTIPTNGAGNSKRRRQSQRHESGNINAVIVATAMRTAAFTELVAIENWSN